MNSPPRRTRTRSKSSSVNMQPVAETAESLNNGPEQESAATEAPSKEDSEVTTEVTTSEEANDAKEESSIEAPQGRKRKATETKGDEQESEEPPAKEKALAVNDKTESPTADASQNDVSNIDDPDTPSVRKGKRARVPNKRYSDLPLLTSTRVNSTDRLPEMNVSNTSAMENGETKENIEAESGSGTDAEIKDEPAGNTSSLNSPAPTRSSKASNAASPAVGSVKKVKTVDMKNPNYLKPFLYGWRRELVYRATTDNTTKRNGDIYYYTPTGKKVRSMREVSENLKNKELNLDDFTFFKEPLGLDDPEKEVIRDAKYKMGGGMAAAAAKKAVAKTPKSNRASATSKAATPTVETPKPKNTTRQSAGGGFKVKLPQKSSVKTKADKKAKEDKSDLEVGTYPPSWNSKKTPAKYGNNLSEMDTKPCPPCSISCQGVLGIVPTLQCRACLCLYHKECVGATAPVCQDYVCKNCQLDQDDGASSAPVSTQPPPLTPINTLVSGNAPSNVLPKLQRIPKAGENGPRDGAVDAALPPPRPNPPFPNPADPTSCPTPGESAKSILGSVTTWFPSSSTIQVSQGSDNSRVEGGVPLAPARPQFVEYVGDKKFLVIPKHNILSISPTIGATAPVLPSLGGDSDSASLGPAHPPEPDAPKDAACADDAPGTTCADDKIETPPPKGKRSARLSAAAAALHNAAVDKSDPASTKMSDSYLQNLAFGYNTLLSIFQYLKVQDLLRASCVCTMWRDIASHRSLWHTVRMKNSQIHSFDGLADALQKHGTAHLDLRKMLLPSNGDDIWPQFSRAIKKVDSLRKIELCRCPATVVEQLALSNPKLQVINAVMIKCETMSLAPLVFLKDLQELRLKSTAGFCLTSDLTALAELKQLRHLSLTSIKDLNKLNIDVIADLRNLESLDLGECTDLPATFGADILIRLHKLEKLRLEKGQGNCSTFEILDAVKNMPHLEQLELVNFDIKGGFDKALGACTNIKKLLIIPTYISQSATTNHMVLGGVLRLQSTLSHFVWGVTLELLRVTELFVDQCEDPEKKEKREKRPVGNGESIPVLKPVPLLKDGVPMSEIPPAQDPPQVEILPLPNLQKLLLQSLPTTRVKILKIPFHATWRQSITDTVN